MENMMIMLDHRAMKYAQEIVKNSDAQKSEKDANAVENLLTKTLGVLQEQGVYASMLFLFSRSAKTDQPIAKNIRLRFYDLIKELPFNWEIQDDNAQSALTYCAEKITADLDKLFLTKEILEQTLIYARYTAKAAGVEATTRGGQKT